MSLVDIIFLAFALGIDCLVVAFAQGLIVRQNRIKNSISLAVIMGLFQCLMPIIGYGGTTGFYKLLFPVSKGIVAGIFLILGIKFIIEAFEVKKEEMQCLGFKCLIELGIATSIDALASGVSIMLTHTNLFLSSAIIGGMSFLMAIIGFFAGSYIKCSKSRYLAIIGGIILIVLAVKALF